LLKLLLLEEKMLGYFSREHLAAVDGHIARSEEFIAKQRNQVAHLVSNGDDARPAEALLSTLLETQALFHDYRTRIEQSLLT